MNLRAYRIAAVLFAALTLFGAWRLYRGDFLSLSTPQRQAAAVAAYVKLDQPVIVLDETIDDRRVLIFTDQQQDRFMGHVQFRRGLLGGWQPLAGGYNTGPVLRSFTLRDKDVRIVFAINCPPEIAHYKVQANLAYEETLMAQGDVTEPRFLHVHETDRDFFPSIYLFDAAGNPLDEGQYLSSDTSSSGPSIGSAEVNLVYVFCAIVLGIGWLIVKYLWDGGAPPKEKNETVG